MLTIAGGVVLGGVVLFLLWLAGCAVLAIAADNPDKFQKGCAWTLGCGGLMLYAAAATVYLLAKGGSDWPVTPVLIMPLVVVAAWWREEKRKKDAIPPPPSPPEGHNSFDDR